MGGLVITVLCCVCIVSVMTVIIWGIYQMEKKDNLNKKKSTTPG